MNIENKIFYIFSIVILFASCYYFDENSIHSPFSQFWQAEMEYDDSNAKRFLNVAAVSLDIDESPYINRNKLIAFIDKITSEQPDVRLILFPETTLGYYHRPFNSEEYQRSVAETIPGDTTNILSLKAVENQIYISLGIVEILDNDLYNSQVLIDPNGNIISVHRKNYLTIEDNENGFKAGQGIALDIIDGIRVATIICHDINSLDINRKIHESHAELVLLPLADAINPLRDFMPFQFTFTWILGTNRCGYEDGVNYNGLLFLSAPSGDRRIRTTGEERYIYGTVKFQ